jgi:hypothetical protein
MAKWIAADYAAKRQLLDCLFELRARGRNSFLLNEEAL